MDGYDNGQLLAGFDFPIGLPMTYAERAGIGSFPDFLPQIGLGQRGQFSNVAFQADKGETTG